MHSRNRSSVEDFALPTTAPPEGSDTRELVSRAASRVQRNSHCGAVSAVAASPAHSRHASFLGSPATTLRASAPGGRSAFWSCRGLGRSAVALGASADGSRVGPVLQSRKKMGTASERRMAATVAEKMAELSEARMGLMQWARDEVRAEERVREACDEERKTLEALSKLAQDR